MSNKLSTLVIDNFIGIPHAEIGFDKPVSVFTGINAAGKSSIRDAISFAFTGKCRGVTKFKDAESAFACNEQKDWGIRLDYYDETNELCIIKRGAKNISKGLHPNPLIPYALDSRSFIALPAKERGALISTILGGGLRDLVKAAITEHIGNVPEAIRAELKTAGVDVFDVDSFREEIVSIRRGFKRELTDLKPDEPKLTSFNLPANFDIAATEKRLADRTTFRTTGLKKIERARVAIENKGTIIDLQREIEKLEGQIKEPPKLRPAQQNFINQAELILSCLDIMENTEGPNGGNICPTCMTLFEGKAGQILVDARRKQISDTRAKYKDKIIEQNKIEVANKEIQIKLNARVDTLARLKKQQKDADVTPKYEAEVGEAESLISKLTEGIARYREYKTAYARHEQDIQRHQALMSLVDECDRIDKALKDGGPVKAAIASGGAVLPVNDKLLQLWGMEQLKWKDNGDITLNSRPVEYASESEKYRAGCVMTLALSQVGKVGFVVLDAYEILVGDAATAILECIEECQLNNVLILVSSTKDYTTAKIPDFCEVFQVEFGKVELLV